MVDFLDIVTVIEQFDEFVELRSIVRTDFGG